jgi:hypothetical protein
MWIIQEIEATVQLLFDLVLSPDLCGMSNCNCGHILYFFFLFFNFKPHHIFLTSKIFPVKVGTLKILSTIITRD